MGGKKIWDVCVIFVGCLLIGVAFNAFFDRFGMAPGGLSGLFVIINHVLHIKLWISNLAFNIPLYIAAYKTLSKEECLKTLCGMERWSSWKTARTTPGWNRSRNICRQFLTF